VRALRLVGLRLQRHAAVDGGDLHVAGNPPEVFGHLRAELARGDEDERERLLRGGIDEVGDRDRERERLARAGRALGENVTAAQRLGNDEALDLERGVDTARGEQVAHDGRNPKGTKISHLSQLLRTSRSCPKAGDAISQEHDHSCSVPPK